MIDQQNHASSGDKSRDIIHFEAVLPSWRRTFIERTTDLKAPFLLQFLRSILHKFLFMQRDFPYRLLSMTSMANHRPAKQRQQRQLRNPHILILAPERFFKIWQERESIIACLEMRLISWGKIKELDRPTTMWSGDNVIKAVKLIEI
jgi:hypothetical protein